MSEPVDISEQVLEVSGVADVVAACEVGDRVRSSLFAEVERLRGLIRRVVDDGAAAPGDPELWAALVAEAEKP